jgi:glycosyltransferase involved in cell wall biosynthesis
VNLLYLVPGEVGGSEIYARRLLDAMHRLEPQRELVVYCGPEALDSLRAEPWAGGARFVVSPVRSRVKALRVAAELTWLPARVRRDGVQLLHSLGTTAPPVCPVASVVSVLDVIYHHFPETFPPASRLGLRIVVPAGARRADRVIAISEAGKREVAATLRLAPEAIDVVYLGFGMDAAEPRITAAPALRRRHGLEGRELVLTVSSSLRHKNLSRLLQAFALLDGDATLVVVGHAGLDQGNLREQAAALGLGDRVLFTGWVDDADLEGFYATATAFVYPSLMEGFGMPVLEAMRRGVPVACSNVSALPEVAGDAAELFDPRDPAAIAAALRTLLGDPQRRDELVRRGHERHRLFTWERAARETQAVYRAVLERRAA